MFFSQVIHKNIKMFISRLKTVRRTGSFAQNFAFTISGNVFVAAITLISAPVISRIFPPESYGSYSVYIAIVNNLSMFSLFMYNIAIVLPKEEETFHNLLLLSFLLNTAFSVFILITTISFANNILNIFSIENIGAFIYLISPTIFLAGTSSILMQWMTREQKFKVLATRNSITNLTLKILTIILGYYSRGSVLAFLVSDLVGKTFSILLLVNKNVINTLRNIILKFNMQSVITVAKEFRRYPLMVLPGEYINLLSGQLPVYIISLYFGNKELGYFAFATSMLGTPINLLANSVRPVFFQKASSVYNEDKNRLGAITSDLFKYIFVLGIIPFSILTVFGEHIFTFIFGTNWSRAGLFAGILGYYFIFQLIASPISSILWVLKKEKGFFKFQVFLFTTRLITLAIGVFLFKELIITLILFSSANTLNYLILTIYVLKIVGLNYLKITIVTVTIILLIFIFLNLIKYTLII